MLLWETLYEIGGEEALNRFEKEMSVLVWSNRGNNEWDSLIHTPDTFLPQEQKEEAIVEGLTAMGCSPLFIEIILELLHTPIIARLDQLRNDFAELNREFRREVEIVLTTGKELDFGTLDYYRSTLSQNYLRDGDKMVLVTNVDPNIINGYRVNVKGRVYDFSVTAEHLKPFGSSIIIKDDERVREAWIELPRYQPTAHSPVRDARRINLWKAEVHTE
eukprot:TRINITY_DN1577_c0_g1_i5.p1 TRINITY_DN1577_c0_g1~~TRINITY_DN1577_c0_g1_i5.p1  ORF type:complete len:218 (-),score=34.71 TRINITY_DN1577_c0_g1_i5:122-775(-)